MIVSQTITLIFEDQLYTNTQHFSHISLTLKLHLTEHSCSEISMFNVLNPL